MYNVKHLFMHFFGLSVFIGELSVGFICSFLMDFGHICIHIPALTVTSSVTDPSGPGQHPPLPPCPHHYRPHCLSSDCQHLHCCGPGRLLCPCPQPSRRDRELGPLGSASTKTRVGWTETLLSPPSGGVTLSHEDPVSPTFPGRAENSAYAHWQLAWKGIFHQLPALLISFPICLLVLWTPFLTPLSLGPYPWPPSVGNLNQDSDLCQVIELLSDPQVPNLWNRNLRSTHLIGLKEFYLMGLSQSVSAHYIWHCLQVWS